MNRQHKLQIVGKLNKTEKLQKNKIKMKLIWISDLVPCLDIEQSIDPSIIKKQNRKKKIHLVKKLSTLNLKKEKRKEGMYPQTPLKHIRAW